MKEEKFNQFLDRLQNLVNEFKPETVLPYTPKAGEYFYVEDSYYNYIAIRDNQTMLTTSKFASYSENDDDLSISQIPCSNNDDIKLIRPATPEEIKLLDEKLAEQGKRFDKEKMELVGISEQLPEIGDLAIFWDTNKRYAHIAKYTEKSLEGYIDNTEMESDNAIKFKSIEQYLNFIK